MPLHQKPAATHRVTAAIAYLLSPALLGATLLLFFSAQHYGWNLATVFAWMSGARILLLLGIEFQFPAKPEWKMSWPSFRRDLKYMVLNGGIAGLLKLAVGWLALDLSRWNTGVIANTPFWVEFVVLLLAYEFFSIGTTA